MTEQIVYRAICAACGVIVREGRLTPDGRVSHGSCRVCARYALNQMEIILFERGLNDEKKDDEKRQAQG